MSGSELRRFAGWLVGLVLVLVCGWGALAFAFHYAWNNTHHPALALALAALLNLGLFVFLEQHFWLSRLMGLRINAGASPLFSAFLFWLFGVPGLLFRSTEPGTSSATAESRSSPQPGEASTDSIREIIETVVFVVVLVLMLRSFVAEAFVIPTGSMAETLYGYQKTVKCPDCGNTFEVNCSSEVDPSEGPAVPVIGCTCPYCRLKIDLVPAEKGAKPTLVDNWRGIVPDPGWNSGDRVLVAKAPYDLVPRDPDRHDVVVFRFPGDSGFPNSGPYRKDTQMNYIKRLIGLPSETIAIHRGKIYVLPRGKLKFKDYEEAEGDPDKLAMLWQHEHMHMDSDQALALWKRDDHPFRIVRKSPDVVLSMMRPVYDNDHPSKVMPERWKGEAGGWVAVDRGFRIDDTAQPVRHEGKADEFHMLSYQHLANRGFELTDKSLEWLKKGVPPDICLNLVPVKGRKFDSARRWDGRDGFLDALATHINEQDLLRYEDKLLTAAWDPKQPELITDFMGYNTYIPHRNSMPGQNWVSDLILECEVVVPQKPAGEFLLELSKGADRFQARWDLASPDGLCTLYRLSDRFKEPQALGNKPTGLRGPGTYRLRFANVDDRLIVWVDGQTPFDGEGGTYEADNRKGPTRENDLDRPASIGARGANVIVRQIKLFRDTYYTATRNSPNTADAGSGVDFGKPNTWGPLSDLPVLTMYVQPGHYLCMGDNSPESSDGRSWGTVPQRLLLGRAVLVYYPFVRGGRIR
jgi:signal peptidase I